MATTRFTNGVTTASPAETLGQYVAPDPTKVISYFNDFHTYAAGDWTVTGSPTVALNDIRGGAISVTAANATDNTVSVLQLSKESFVIQSGKKAWFKTRIKQATASEGDFVAGLFVADTTPVASAPSDGIYFRKDDDDALIDIVARVDSADAASSTSLATLVADTFVTLGFYFDGAATVYVYVDDALKAKLTLTAANIAALDDETLSLGFAFQNGTTVAHVGTVDYVFGAVER